MVGSDPSPQGNATVPVRASGLSAFPRRLRWAAAVAALLVVAGLAVGSLVGSRWPGLGGVFGAQTTDRSQPVLLQSMRDLSRFVAAEGTYQVVIDLQRDRRYVPDFLLEERTLLVGTGTAEAYVDFASLADGAVTVSEDRRSVRVALPGPQLGPPRLDLARSYVFAEQRGLLNRLSEVFGGAPDRQRVVYQLAEQRIGAAAGASGLLERAAGNTRQMIEGLLRSLGFDQVEVVVAAVQ
ncbi:DUF4230 domain-containing protein [Pilimelia columellifera]|uniref:DUF4230 domain-containing protein n=1 Tax=Pilimelia columellifera subsp. columellifera TaxID=706583 RepID=A0ABN3MWD9_9ACTN